MGQINSITVRASDGIKTVDYAPPRLYDITALITPTDDENVDRLIADTLDRIKAAGDRYLHGTTAAPKATAVANDAATVTDTPVDDPAPRKRRRTATEIAADAALAKAAHPKGETDYSAVTDDPSLIASPDDDFKIEGEPPAPEDDPANAVEDFSIDGEPEVSEEITDAALNAAVQRKNSELGDPEAIRAVIKTYNPDPTKTFQLREIPQAKRAEFITKLGGLTKAA